MAMMQQPLPSIGHESSGWNNQLTPSSSIHTNTKMFEPAQQQQQQHKRRITHENPIKGMASAEDMKLFGQNLQHLSYQRNFDAAPPAAAPSPSQLPLEGDFDPLMEPLPIGPEGYRVVKTVPSFGRQRSDQSEDSIAQLLSSLSEELSAPSQLPPPQAQVEQQTQQQRQQPVGQDLAPPMNTRPITPNNVMKATPLPFTLKELEEDFRQSKANALAAATVSAPSPSMKPTKCVSTVAPRSMNAVSSKPRRFRRDQADQWSTMFQALLEFKERYGHCSVPRTSKDYPLLGRWVKRQRYQYKLMCDGNRKSTMTPERAQALVDVGFVWDSYSAAWSQRFEDLKQFVAKYGHANVPSPFPENPQLSNWCKFQRREYKSLLDAGNGKGKMSQTHMDRIMALESLGFQWELRRSSKRSSQSSSSSRKMSL